MFCKDKEGHSCHCLPAGTVLALIGIVYILKDLGYVSFKVGLWPLLVFLVGIHFLFCGMNFSECKK